MFGSDPHWFYDDPAGVPDEGGVPVRLPEALLESVRVEAARYGVTPAAWLVAIAEHHLRPTRPTAA